MKTEDYRKENNERNFKKQLEFQISMFILMEMLIIFFTERDFFRSQLQHASELENVESQDSIT
jgi:hypothetical protein